MKKLLLLAVVLGTLVSCGGKKEAAAGAAAPAGGKVKIGVVCPKFAFAMIGICASSGFEEIIS